ncbi:bifunctional phosphopantothenoylcysteine decarboxylase/phosphopantothenate--cysteine ligase CoaBC [Pseudomonadota bacterium]
MAGRRVVVGVSGGIAAYKSAELVRRLRQSKAEVRVVMTSGAKAFITPLTMQALSGHAVHSELMDPAAEAAMGHIELARWADVVLIAPASANLLARIAGGLADDLLTTLCLATQAPVLVAPAMNHVMWGNPATQANVQLLRQHNIEVLGPAEGEQACGEVGEGRMLEPCELVAAVAKRWQTGVLSGRRVVLTAGPTREAIDPVRYVSNRSSGKMGYAIAQAAVDAGASVVLVSGPTALDVPNGVQCVSVESAKQMLQAVEKTIERADVFISVAAVADYRPIDVASKKIKKQSAEMEILLERTDDILALVASKNEAVFTVGFAAETNDLEQYAKDKLERKGLDMVAANHVGNGRGFESDENALSVFWSDGQKEIERADKLAVARQLISVIAERYYAQASN